MQMQYSLRAVFGIKGSSISWLVWSTLQQLMHTEPTFVLTTVLVAATP